MGGEGFGGESVVESVEAPYEWNGQGKRGGWVGKARPELGLANRFGILVYALTESSADVGSSSISNAGSRSNARAIATLCRWPPESDPPLAPINVW